MAILSILGLYKYDPDVFSEFSPPSRIYEQKDLLVLRIVEECAELELLRPDWEYMRESIALWSSTNAVQWEKLVETLFLEYDPISNYDRNETWTDVSNGSAKVAAFNSNELVDSSAGNSSSTHTGRTHGNIGVTTSQQMLEEERRVAVWSFADYLVADFKKRFCILVY